MDKLDIFKLLTSAYDFYQNKSKKNTDKQDDSNFLSKILNAPKTDNTTNETKEEKVENKEKVKLVPLQEKMLSTMRSHDEFVSRVMQKNKEGGK